MRISDWSSDVCSSDLNNVFYVLVANELMDAGDNRFDELLAQIEGLPDRSFGDVSEIVLHAADVCYFNDISRSPERAVELRRRLVARASKLRYWNRDPRPGDLSVDRDTGGVVATLDRKSTRLNSSH